MFVVDVIGVGGVGGVVVGVVFDTVCCLLFHVQCLLLMFLP